MKEKLEEYLSLLSDDFKFEIKSQSENSVFLRIWQPLSVDKFLFNKSNYFNTDDVVGDVERSLVNLRRDFNFDVLYIYTICKARSGKNFERKLYTEDDLGSIDNEKIKSFCLCLNNIN